MSEFQASLSQAKLIAHQKSTQTLTKPKDHKRFNSKCEIPNTKTQSTGNTVNISKITNITAMVPNERYLRQQLQKPKE